MSEPTQLLIAEVVRLRAIVGKLPKTADGEPVVPGMKLWIVNSSNEAVETEPLLLGDSEGWLQDYEMEVYSTREAAEAAK
jgi:hypothetical protein